MTTQLQIFKQLLIEHKMVYYLWLQRTYWHNIFICQLSLKHNFIMFMIFFSELPKATHGQEGRTTRRK